MRATAAEESQYGGLVLLCLASWAIPGAGHLWLGRRNKGLIFLVTLPLMFAIGLSLRGRLFPFGDSDALARNVNELLGDEKEHSTSQMIDRLVGQ